MNSEQIKYINLKPFDLPQQEIKSCGFIVHINNKYKGDIIHMGREMTIVYGGIPYRTNKEKKKAISEAKEINKKAWIKVDKGVVLYSFKEYNYN